MNFLLKLIQKRRSKISSVCYLTDQSEQVLKIDTHRRMAFLSVLGRSLESYLFQKIRCAVTGGDR